MMSEERIILSRSINNSVCKTWFLINSRHLALTVGDAPRQIMNIWPPDAHHPMNYTAGVKTTLSVSYMEKCWELTELISCYKQSKRECGFQSQPLNALVLHWSSLLTVLPAHCCFSLFQRLANVLLVLPSLNLQWLGMCHHVKR